MNRRRVAFYGKGGIGKSTTAANVSAALAEKGLKVMQIGCDPKADSTSSLLGGTSPRTILDCSRDGEPSLEDVIDEGYLGVLCAECGGPSPGVGCAGRGIITAFETLDRLKAFEVHEPDIVIYDVLGDVVCGGFAMPIRNGYARDVYIVSSGERMSVFAAKNIAMAVDNFKHQGYARLCGLVQNSRGVVDEDTIIDGLASDIDAVIAARLPRDPVVQECERVGKTVMEHRPDSGLANLYRGLASRIWEQGGHHG